MTKPQRYHTFWQSFLVRLKRSRPGYTNATATTKNFMEFGSGTAGFRVGAAFVSEIAPPSSFMIELFIDKGKQNRAENKEAFRRLEAMKATLEGQLGRLTWQSLPDSRACRIFAHKPGSITSSAKELNELEEWGVTKLLEFRDVFGPKLKNV